MSGNLGRVDIDRGTDEVHVIVSHIKEYAASGSATIRRQFDFDAVIEHIIAFFPKGQSAKLKVFLRVEGSNIIMAFDRDSGQEYLAGDDMRFDEPLFYPLKRGLELQMYVENTDTVFPHTAYIWLVIKKKRRGRRF